MTAQQQSPLWMRGRAREIKRKRAEREALMKINSGAQREARVERIGGDDEWRAVQSSTSMGKVLMRQTSECVCVCVCVCVCFLICDTDSQKILANDIPNFLSPLGWLRICVSVQHGRTD